MTNSNNISVKKICKGFYEYSLGADVVEVVSRDPNPAFGDTKEMWIANRASRHYEWSDPVETKREAVAIAKQMLLERAK